MRKFAYNNFDTRPVMTKNSFKIFQRDLGYCNELLDQYSEYYFIRKIQQYGSNQALTELIKYHIGFIVSVARSLYSSYIDFEDLINEGIIGFIEASHRFNINNGNKFLSYAVWYIRAYMVRSISENYELARLPLNQYTFLSKVKNKLDSLFKERGEDFDNKYEFIAEELEVPKSKIFDIMHFLTRDKIVSFEDNYESFVNPYSLMETNLKVEDTFIYDDNPYEEDDDLRNESLQCEVKRVLRTLTERESDIIILYFGLDYDLSSDELVLEFNNIELTSSSDDVLTKIGELFGLTRERIHQIKERAIRRMRHTSRSKLLRSYLG